MLRQAQDQIKDLVTSSVGQKPTHGPSVDDLFDILSNDRRRRLVAFVERSNDVVTRDDLADVIATHEFGDDYSSKQRKRAYISVYQTHLPQLIEADVLDPVDGRGNSAHTFEPGDHVDAYADALYAVRSSRLTTDGGEDVAEDDHLETFAGTVVMEPDDEGVCILDDGDETQTVVLGTDATAYDVLTDVDIGQRLSVTGVPTQSDRLIATDVERVDGDQKVVTGGGDGE